MGFFMSSLFQTRVMLILLGFSSFIASSTQILLQKVPLLRPFFNYSALTRDCYLTHAASLLSFLHFAIIVDGIYVKDVCAYAI